MTVKATTITQPDSADLVHHQITTEESVDSDHPALSTNYPTDPTTNTRQAQIASNDTFSDATTATRHNRLWIVALLFVASALLIWGVLSMSSLSTESSQGASNVTTTLDEETSLTTNKTLAPTGLSISTPFPSLVTSPCNETGIRQSSGTNHQSLAPTVSPSLLATSYLTNFPSEMPSSSRLTRKPTTSATTHKPTPFAMTTIPTRRPTTLLPTRRPFTRPTDRPTRQPTGRPTTSPIAPTGVPSSAPATEAPATSSPTMLPPTTALPTASPAQIQTTTFYVIGDVPYNPQQARELQAQMQSIPATADFVVHVGDIRSAADESAPCRLQEYRDVLHILQLSAVPVLMVPGDNEWNDCPNRNQAWSYWLETFAEMETQYWDANDRFDNMVRMRDRPETFGFVHKGTLFVGLNLVGGQVHNANEWQTRLTEQVAWLRELMRLHNKPTVVFGHANPINNHDDFFLPLRDFVRDEWSLPLLYVNGDKHSWEFNESFFGQSNWQRIMVSGGTTDPPLLVQAHAGPKIQEVHHAFAYDRQL